MRSYFFIILGGVFLGTIGTFSKLGSPGIPVMTLNFYRLLFAFLFLLFVMPCIDRTAFSVTRKDLRLYIPIGVFLAITFSVFTTASVLAPIQNVVLLSSLYPVFVLVFASVLLREKITRTKLVSLGLVLLGIAILNPVQLGSQNIGNVFALLTAILFAFLLVSMRYADTTHGIGDVLWFFFFAMLALSPFPFLYGFGEFSFSFVSVILLGVVSTGIGYLFFNIGLKSCDAETASMLLLMFFPVFSIIFAVILLGESLTPHIIFGGALLVLAGIYLEMQTRRTKPKKKRAFSFVH